MATTPNILSVSDLDFDKIKNNLKTFMKSQSQFKDYDFEGASLSILIDLLAYNTHYNGFYANMIANEMFLDTAVFRESIVSKAKMLGYTPSSRRCATAYVNLVSYIKIVEGESAPSTVTLDAYAKFKSSVADTEYIFLTNEAHILERDSSKDTAESWGYTKNVVKLYEGTHLTYEFEVTSTSLLDSTTPDTEHYIIPSNKLDTTTLIVEVQNSVSDLTTNVFSIADELQSITSTDYVYWLHEVEDNKYEMKFGDGVNIGVALDLGNVIKVDYIATNGPDANGCKSFTSSQKTYSRWAESMPIVEASLIATAVNYRVLEVSQGYVANFIEGETIYGSASGASGELEEWDIDNGILYLIGAQGTFLLNETITGATSGVIATVNMSSLEVLKSANGTERESSESIKNLASKTYQSQNRCVTTNDYEAIIKKEYPNIRAIKVWGGEENVPPVYGKVFIALRPHIGQILSNSVKERIRTDILGKRNIITVQTEIIDPDYIYLIVSTSVKYNPAKTTNSSAQLVTLVGATIREYASTYLNDFTSPFYSTQLTANIDDTDDAITSNILTVQMKKYFDPILGQETTNQVIDFNNTFLEPGPDVEVGFSSTFTFGGVSGCQFASKTTDFSVLQVIDGNGSVVSGGENVGEIDYKNGTVTIKNFTCSATEKTNTGYPDFKGRIELIANPREYDIFARGHQIIDILNADISVTTTDVRTLL